MIDSRVVREIKPYGYTVRVTVESVFVVRDNVMSVDNVNDMVDEVIIFVVR